MEAKRAFLEYQFVDVVRRTRTILDVMQECQIDDCWNADGAWMHSGQWTGFTQVTQRKHHPPRGHTWSGRGRLTKIQATSRPENTRTLVKHIKEISATRKKRWVEEEEKLDNKQKLRGICCVDLLDKEVNETLKMRERRKKCKWILRCCADREEKNGDDHWYREIDLRPESAQQKLTTETQNKDHEDHSAERGINSVSQLQSCAHVTKIPDAKAAVDEEWDKLENTPAWQESKVESKQEVIDDARREGKTSHFATLIGFFVTSKTQKGKNKSKKTKDALNWS